GFVSYRNITGLMDKGRWVTHTHEVLNGVENLLSLMKDAETGQRGYIITGQQSYLEPFNQATGKIHQQVSELRRLTADNPNQQEAIAALEPLIVSKLSELRQTIDLRKRQGFEAA